MLKVYEQEVSSPFLIREDNGEKYANPNVDMHLVGARAIFPFIEEYPLWEQLKISKKALPDGIKPRNAGKVFNFGKLIMPK